MNEKRSGSTMRPPPRPILAIIALAIVLALLVGQENPVQFASTTHTDYRVEGTSYYNQDGVSIALPPYDGSTFDAYVNFTITGSPTGTLYELYYSTDNGATWVLLTPSYTSSDSYAWSYSGDWSAWNRLRLVGAYDGTGILPQRPAATAADNWSVIS